MSPNSFTIGAVLLALAGCGDGGSGPADPGDGPRIASQFEHLAEQIGDSGSSPTADALRHAADIVRLVGHATPVVVSIDGSTFNWLAVAEQIDIPEVQCSWPADSGVTAPGDSGITASGDSVIPPSGGGEGECTQTGTYSMRTLIAWEPERMDQVIRIFADPGTSEVFDGVPDVMAGLPEPTVAGDTAVSGGGGTISPGFMGEYLLRDGRTFTTVGGNQSNELEASGGSCTSDRFSFDWAEFSCETVRIRFAFDAQVVEVRSEPLTGMPGPEPSAGDGESHTLALGSSSVDGARLTVVAWQPPPPPEPGPGPDPVPLPVDSTAGSD